VHVFAQGKLKDEGVLIDEGKINDQEMIENYYKKQATIKALRETYCFRKDHAEETAFEIKDKASVDEALEWLRFHKEKDFQVAMKLKEKKDAGEVVHIKEREELEEEQDD